MGDCAGVSASISALTEVEQRHEQKRSTYRVIISGSYPRMCPVHHRVRECCAWYAIGVEDEG